MNEKARNNLISLVAATALYAVQSFLLSAQKRNIFNIPADKNAVYFLAVCFSFLSGAAFWFVCIRAIFCIKDKETSKVKEFAICFIPLFIILMLVFPGIFKGDEFYVLYSIVKLFPVPFYHTVYADIYYLAHLFICIFRA